MTGVPISEVMDDWDLLTSEVVAGMYGLLERWGALEYLDGTGRDGDGQAAAAARVAVEVAAREGRLTWRELLAEATTGVVEQREPIRLYAALAELEAAARCWRLEIRRRMAAAESAQSVDTGYLPLPGRQRGRCPECGSSGARPLYPEPCGDLWHIVLKGR